MNVACLLVGGADRTIAVGGADYLFEDHPHMGPCPLRLLKRKGQPPITTERDLPPEHPFWAAVSRWYEEGKQIGPDGRCIWTPAPDPMAGALHVGGKHWMFPPLPAGVEVCPGCERCNGRPWGSP